MIVSSGRLKKSQAALEYMVIIGIVMVLLTPILLKSMESTESFNRNMNLLKAEDALGRIADAAKTVYFQGPPSTMTIRVVYPDRIVASDVSGKEAYFRISLGEYTTDVVEIFEFNVTGSISGNVGERTIRIEALENVVNITRIN